MNPFEADRLGRLARVLNAPPRHVLVLAARLARAENVDDPRRGHALLSAQTAGEAAEMSALLMMTPIASFAQDDLAAALALPASTRGVADE